MPQADVTVNRSAYTVTATMSNAGQVGVSLLVFPTSTWPLGHPVHGRQRHPHDLHVDGGREERLRLRLLDLRAGRVRRSFAGGIVGASTTTGQIPRVTGTPVTGSAPSLQLTLANDGTTAVTYTLTASDSRHHQARHGRRDGSTNVTWPVDSNGYYDVIITANTSDGFTRRYAGRIA